MDTTLLDPKSLSDTQMKVAEKVLLTILEGAGLGDKLIPYGSRVVCDPPVLDTDIDFFFYVSQDSEKTLSTALETYGFVEDLGGPLDSSSSRPSWGNEEPDRRFRSWKMGLINLVTTSSAIFAERHVAATRLCKRLNLLDKKDRVAVYQAVLYGKTPE